MDLQNSLSKIWQRLFPTEEQRAERDLKHELTNLKTALEMAVRGREFDRDAQERYTHAIVATGAWSLTTPEFYKDFRSDAEKNEAIRKYSDALKQKHVTDIAINCIIKATEADMRKKDIHPYDVI